jgi:hypothetical protein
MDLERLVDFICIDILNLTNYNVTVVCIAFCFTVSTFEKERRRSRQSSSLQRKRIDYISGNVGAQQVASE